MKKLYVFCLSVFMLVSSSTFAYECVGKVGQLVIPPSGTVTTSLGNMGWVYLCNVSTSYNGVAPDTCKSIFSQLLAAKLADKNVRMWFSDTSNDCTNAKHPAGLIYKIGTSGLALNNFK